MQHVGLLHEKEITEEYGDKARYLFHEVRIFASPLLCPSFAFLFRANLDCANGVGVACS